MRVQEILIEGNKKRYMLLDKTNNPIVPVVKYLKFLDNVGKSVNTQKTYCYSLKLYFSFLDDSNKDYRNININDLSDFVAWLRSPYESNKVTSLHTIKAKRTEKTVNHAIGVVTRFYDYLYTTDKFDNDIYDKLVKHIHTRGYRVYKDFLFHINKDNPVSRNILRLKVPKSKVKVLTKEEVEIIYKSITNIRDRFLIRLLYETGLRIGEALSLFIEDFICDYRNGHRIKLVDRGELVNGAKLKTGERELHISQELMDLFDDYMYEVLDELEVDSNFVFVLLKGPNKGYPMSYQSVDALFKRIRSKTGIDCHPHTFRHTHATIYYRQTKSIKQVQERLGHSQVQTTMNLYVHPSDEDIKASWETAKPAFKLFDNNRKELNKQ